MLCPSCSTPLSLAGAVPGRSTARCPRCGAVAELAEEDTGAASPFDLPSVAGDPLPDAELERIEACYGRWIEIKPGESPRQLEHVVARLAREVRRLRAVRR